MLSSCYSLDYRGGLVQHLPLRLVQGVNSHRKASYTASASQMHHAYPARSRTDSHEARVRGVWLARHQSVALKRVYQSAHGWRTHLLRGRERSESERTGKDRNRQR